MGRNYPIWKVSVFGKWVSAKASRERHCTTADCCGAAPSLAASAACLSQCVAFTLPPSRCARRQRQEHEQDSPDCSRRQSQCWKKRTLQRSYRRTAEAWQLSRGYGGTEVRPRSEEHTSELQSLMRISYAVFCLKK